MVETATAEAGFRRRELSKTQRLMVRAMKAAWSVPMFPITVEVDMTAALARRQAGATVTDILLLHCAATLAKHPGLNAHWQDEGVVEYDDVNLGLAVASDRGLTVPVIHRAQALSLAEIAGKRNALVDKVRSGRIGIAEVTGGTFTISNLGMLGVSRFTAIINPPQVAILAVGSTVRRQVWHDGKPDWRPMAELTLTSDHRAVDGAHAAAFLNDLKSRLEADVDH